MKEGLLRERLPQIDALRGIACLAVLLFHLRWTFGQIVGPVPAFLDPVIRHGHLGVQLFLVLSGFCLFYPLARKDDYRLNLGSYARRRAWRILPPYYISLLIYAVIASAKGEPVSVMNLSVHAAMLHNLTPGFIWTLNAPYWSLALEAQLYVAFPLLVWLGVKRGWSAPLVLTLGVSLAWFLLCPYQDEPTRKVWFAGVPTNAFGFACGMVSAWLVHRKLPSLDRVFLLSGAFALAWAVWRMPTSNSPELDILTVQLFGLFFAALVLLLSRSTLRFPAWLVWLGTISYSVYICHLGVIWLVQAERLPNLMPQGIATALAYFGGVPLAIAVSAVFHRFCERPFMRGIEGRKWAKLPALDSA